MIGPKVIYLMRHGATALDDSHRSDSWIDLPLSDEGRNEVVGTMAEHLKGVPIQCIYTSDLKRAEETAHILKSGLTSDPDIEVKPAMRTWNLGDLAGDIKGGNKPMVVSLISHPNREAPNGESYNQFKERFDPFMEKQMKDVSSGREPGPILQVLSGSNMRRMSEKLFDNRTILDVTESGLVMIYPTDGEWSAMVICGHKDDDDEAS